MVFSSFSLIREDLNGIHELYPSNCLVCKECNETVEALVKLYDRDTEILIGLCVNCFNPNADRFPRSNQTVLFTNMFDDIISGTIKESCSKNLSTEWTNYPTKQPSTSLEFLELIKKKNNILGYLGPIGTVIIPKNNNSALQNIDYDSEMFQIQLLPSLLNKVLQTPKALQNLWQQPSILSLVVVGSNKANELYSYLIYDDDCTALDPNSDSTDKLSCSDDSDMGLLF